METYTHDGKELVVFGSPEASALEQARRCLTEEHARKAVLCADNHKGYGLPIGGVIAYENAIAPAGVGYDIACLASGTLVTTEARGTRRIENVDAAMDIPCWDGNEVRTVRPNLGCVHKGSKNTVSVRLANGRTVTCTPDHLLRTKDGWRRADALTGRDSVACPVFVGLPIEDAHAGAILPVIVPEPQASELREKGLLPLCVDDRRLPALLRLLGYACGDGHLTRDGKRLSLYTSRDEDVALIVRDVESLGFRAYCFKRNRANGSRENNIIVNSRAFCALLAALGCPAGRKQWPEDPMPWLTSGVLPRHLVANYLSGFCSAEMMTPRRLPGYIPNLQVKQTGEGEDHAIRFVARLFDAMGLAASVAPSGPARGERQDWVLQVLGGAEAQLRFLEIVGFCYAREKRVRGAEAASVAWQNRAGRQRRQEARTEARALQAAGAGYAAVMADVPDRYGVAPGFVHHSLYEDRGGVRRAFRETFEPDTDGEIAWVPVASVEDHGIEEVFDIVTGDPAHCFFAEGMVVHNCGNLAVRTDLRWSDIKKRIGGIMDAIYSEIPFGIGRRVGKPEDHPLFDSQTWKDVPEIRPLKDLAYKQLGTVGSGNHYVDIFVETSGTATLEPEAPQDDRTVWVGVHFGSRGFGWKTAAGFMKYAMGLDWDDRAPGEKAEQPVDVIPITHENFHKYVQAMQLAGEYAYAGRERVVADVLEILGRYVKREVDTTKRVHNHHNYAWLEEHDGRPMWVVRKGATPLMPGQRGFVGGSMGDIAVILRGLDTERNQLGMHSAMHGAGRVMSRTAAAGKRSFKTVRDAKGKVIVKKGEILSPGRVDENAMRRRVREFGVELRGAGADEAPDVYRPLKDVLKAHVGTLEVEHVLKPVGVAMAGADNEDPYKD